MKILISCIGFFLCISTIANGNNSRVCIENKSNLNFSSCSSIRHAYGLHYYCKHSAVRSTHVHAPLAVSLCSASFCRTKGARVTDDEVDIDYGDIVALWGDDNSTDGIASVLESFLSFFTNFE